MFGSNKTKQWKKNQVHISTIDNALKQKTADSVTFTKEIVNGKLHFLYSVPYVFRVPFNSNLIFLKKYIKKIGYAGHSS